MWGTALAAHRRGMSTNIDTQNLEQHLPVRDIVVGAVTFALVGGLLVALALVVKGAVDVLGSFLLAS